MRRLFLTLAVVAIVAAISSARADHRFSYPKVRTFSGGYYGPTQAHYQYLRRYGRPWQGTGGLSAGYGLGYVNGYPGNRFYSSYGYGWPSYGFPSYGYGFGFPYGLGGGGYGYSTYYGGTSLYGPGWGWSSFGVSPFASYPFGVTVIEPSLVLQNPGVYTPFPSTNPLVNDALLNNGYLWQQQVPDLAVPQVEPLGVEPIGKPDLPPPPTSTPAARLRSLQHQQAGDARMQKLDYLQAYLRYQDAISAARERVEPHYRMGIALAGMKRFDKAVRELKTATSLDPTWVETVTLLDLLGEDNLIGKTQLKQRVAEWALEDAYDADRLYLLGTLLYLDGDRDRAGILFDTARALVGNEPHLAVFHSPPVSQEAEPDVPPAPQGPQLPPLPTDENSTQALTPPGPVLPSQFK